MSPHFIRLDFSAGVHDQNILGNRRNAQGPRNFAALTLRPPRRFTESERTRPRRVNTHLSDRNFIAGVKSRVSCPIARRYHFYRNDESSLGPEYESGSYASDGFLRSLSLVFDEMRLAQSICVFVCSLFSDFHVVADSVVAKRSHALRKIDPSDDCKERLESSG